MVVYSVTRRGAIAPSNQGHVALGADRYNISLSIRLRFLRKFFYVTKKYHRTRHYAARVCLYLY